ncbi:MAG: DUF418 domain-containing protein [Leptolyngbya sp. PLA1]|nr:DUF418 domain-containing protein [Leptolyngbya sp. PLA1]
MVRGFALLGIFLVNITLFAEPFGTMMHAGPVGGLWNNLVHFGTLVLCTGKFYLLFSLLFGAGFALQRARGAGAGWAKVYLRRLGFLLLMGFAHAILLWYGDILFLYAIAGVVLLIFGFVEARAKILTGVIILAIAGVLSAGFMAITAAGQAEQARQKAAALQAAPDEPTPDPGAPAAKEEEETKPTEPFWSTPFGELIWGFKTQQIQQPDNKVWHELERRAYHDGPYSQVFLFRAFTWVMMLVFVMLGFGWTIIAMFFIGAGLAGSGFFGPDRSALHRRFMVLGAVLGLPLVGVSVYMMSGSKDAPGLALRMGAAALLGAVGAPLMTMGYLSLWTWLTNHGKVTWLTSRLAATGRMALTNYLTQTVVCTTVFYYYGGGLFGETTHVERLGLVALVYGLQLFVISPLWMSRFRYGPLEWLWRSVTYWRLEPLARA